MVSMVVVVCVYVCVCGLLCPLPWPDSPLASIEDPLGVFRAASGGDGKCILGDWELRTVVSLLLPLTPIV